MSDTRNKVTERLTELGIILPDVAKPVAAYVPAVKTGNLVHTSGQLPFVDGKLPVVGKVGDAIDTDQAAAMARIAALNALAAVHDLVGIDHVTRVVKVTGFVSSAAGYADQPLVINGASNVLGEIFGDAGQHARSAVGVYELPLHSPVEVEITVEVDN